MWPPHGPGYVLVGNPAGMINLATEEEIAYAYETGQLPNAEVAGVAGGMG